MTQKPTSSGKLGGGGGTGQVHEVPHTNAPPLCPLGFFWKRGAAKAMEQSPPCPPRRGGSGMEGTREPLPPSSGQERVTSAS